MENMDNNQTPPAAPGPETVKGNPEPVKNNTETVREIHHHHYERRGRGLGRFFWGLFVIFLGLVFLAQAIGFVGGVDAGQFFARFWPVFIIFAGVSMLARGNWISKIISVILVIILFAVMGVLVFAPNIGHFGSFSFRTSQPATVQAISVDKDTGMQTAEVAVSAGAGQINISGGSDKLVTGSLESNISQIDTSSAILGTNQSVNLKANGKWFNLGDWKNNLNLQLTTSTPLALSVSAGSSSTNLDLKDVQIARLDVDAGASSLNVDFGDKVSGVTAAIHAGASSVTITVPKTMGVKLSLKGGLSSKNISDFNQTGPESFQSINYGAAPGKIDLSIDAGVSSITVKWQ